jgi:hypothetical protein
LMRHWETWRPRGTLFSTMPAGSSWHTRSRLSPWFLGYGRLDAVVGRMCLGLLRDGSPAHPGSLSCSSRPGAQRAQRPRVEPESARATGRRPAGALPHPGRSHLGQCDSHVWTSTDLLQPTMYRQLAGADRELRWLRDGPAPRCGVSRPTGTAADSTRDMFAAHPLLQPTTCLTSGCPGLSGAFDGHCSVCTAVQALRLVDLLATQRGVGSRVAVEIGDWEQVAVIVRAGDHPQIGKIVRPRRGQIRSRLARRPGGA